jgi:hypothetical protein
MLAIRTEALSGGEKFEKRRDSKNWHCHTIQQSTHECYESTTATYFFVRYNNGARRRRLGRSKSPLHGNAQLFNAFTQQHLQPVAVGESRDAGHAQAAFRGAVDDVDPVVGEKLGDVRPGRGKRDATDRYRGRGTANAAGLRGTVAGRVSWFQN